MDNLEYTHYFDRKYSDSLNVSLRSDIMAKMRDKYTIKTLKKYLSDGSATYSFNKAIKVRDSKDGRFRCISCWEVKPLSQFNAGHFLSAGSNPALRYHWDNVHGECVSCNCLQ